VKTHGDVFSAGTGLFSKNRRLRLKLLKKLCGTGFSQALPWKRIQKIPGMQMRRRPITL
jgi:hypothetical protein